RQQTLRATIDWSYSLLSEDEQTLFAQLSVFAGGCTFEAAEAICHFDGNLDLLERLASLVDKSLVRQEGREGPRFVMLETIREYAQERMGLGGVSRELKWQHAHYYLHLAEASSLELPGPGQTVRLERLEAEHDNLRAALQWARDTGDVELGLRLAVALGRFWQMRGPLSEGQRWLDVFLAVDAGAPRVLRAEALFVAGQLVASRRHGGEAAELFERSLALYRELGDKPARTEAVSALALELLQRRDLDRAAALLEEGVALARELEDKALLEMSLRYLGVVVAGQGDAERARDLRDQSLNVYRELEVGRRAATLLRPGVGAPQARGGVPRIHAAVNRYLWVWFGETFIADPAFNRALGARIRGDYGEAVQLLGELLAQALDVGDRRYAAYARMFLGLLARDQGDYERAKALYTESLATFRNVDDDFGTAMALIGLSDVARDQGQAERVIELAEEGLGLMSKVGDTLFTGFCLHNLASAARYRGDYERAESLFAESLALLGDPGGSRSPAAEVLSSLGLLALERGDYQRAEEAFTEGLRAAREVGAHYVLGTLLEGMAGVAIGRGLAERAARLLGAAQAVRSALGTPIWPANRGLVEAQVAATRSALAADRYSDAWEEGQTMAAEEAIGFALTDTTLP
ncbi:MAG: tetratricopeptide repeat protein, partial [Chloroflexi bacterium]|nr:tetratricopeptide repeat protein [Chloroflexota bacterium]